VACKDRYDYYEMLLEYVDDVFAISHEPKILIDTIGLYYKVMPRSDKEPDINLGANVKKMQMPDGREVCATSQCDYVKNAIKTVKGFLADDGEGYILKNKAKNPFPMNFQPQLDVSNKLGLNLFSCYLQLIGIARWAIELGCIDIHNEVSLLSHYQLNPRVGHLEAFYHVFAYMKSLLDIGHVAFDPKTPVVDKSAFSNGADWKEFYGEVQEEVPPKMPKPWGQRVTISAFVDANHAGNKVTRCLHIQIIIYVQNSPILWYSKRQNTVEEATFGSEMDALRICKEKIVAIRYKLRMFDIEIDGPVNVFCDNCGIVKNVSILESMLMKKHNAIERKMAKQSWQIY
jgi:hypothetical protein